MAKVYSRFVIGILIIALLAVLAAGASFGARTVSAKLLRNGLSYARSQDYAGAERLFRQAVRWNRKNSEAYVQLAIVLERQNRFEAAYDIVSDAEKRFGAADLNYLRIKSEKGKIARYVGKSEESETLLKEVLASRPQDGLAHFRLGHIYYDRGEFEKAKTEYETAVRLDPKSAQFRSALAAVLIEDNLKEAEIQLQLARQLEPLFPSTYNNLAVIYQKRGQYTIALPYINYAIQLNPQKPEYYITKAEIYEAMGDMEHAFGSYRKAAELLMSSPLLAQSLRDSVNAKLKSLGSLQ